MINQQRNERFWVEGCGWLVLDNLPDPSDHVSFTGLMLRYALPKVREKHGDDAVLSFWKSAQGENCQITYRVAQSRLPWTWHDLVVETPTLSEAMFLAFEKALLGPQNDQQAG